jgi:hypothetical protein
MVSHRLLRSPSQRAVSQFDKKSLHSRGIFYCGTSFFKATWPALAPNAKKTSSVELKATGLAESEFGDFGLWKSRWKDVKWMSHYGQFRQNDGDFERTL